MGAQRWYVPFVELRDVSDLFVRAHYSTRDPRRENLVLPLIAACRKIDWDRGQSTLRRVKCLRIERGRRSRSAVRRPGVSTNKVIRRPRHRSIRCQRLVRQANAR